MQTQSDSFDSLCPSENGGPGRKSNRSTLDSKNLLRFANILVYLREDLERTRTETLPSSSLLRQSLVDLEPEMKNLTYRLEDWQACVMILLQQLSMHMDARISRFARMALKHMARIHQKSESPAHPPIH